MASKRNLTIGLVLTGAAIAFLARSEDGWTIACLLIVYGLLIVWRVQVQSYLKRLFGMPQRDREASQETRPMSPARLKRELKIADQGRAVRRIVREHLPTLSRNRRRLIMADEYGVSDDSKWRQHVESFFVKVVAPQLPYGRLEPVLRNSIRDWIDEAIDIYEEEMADVE